MEKDKEKDKKNVKTRSLAEHKMEIKKSRSYEVVKSNKFLEQIFVTPGLRLSPKEFTLLNFIISRIKSTDKSLNSVFMKISELCEIMGVTYCGQNVKYLEAAFKNLRNKSAYIELGDGKRMLFAWLDTLIFDRTTGLVEVKLSASLEPFLIALRNRYYKYEIANLLALKGKAVFLFDSLQMHLYEGKVTYTVEELKDLLDCSDAYENSFKDFSKRVLKPAVKQINELTDLNIDMEFNRTGRSVSSITFTISSKEDSLEKLEMRYRRNEAIDGDNSML